MKNRLFLLFSLISLSIPTASYAEPMQNDGVGDIKVVGIIGNGQSVQGSVEKQPPPIEEIATVIKDTDLTLPKAGGDFFYGTILLGIALLCLSYVIYRKSFRTPYHKK
ncbi:LPXTG cell wall anchor domain-containing protein [Bacillus cereus]|uniref:LPXTG cell wall anchor domain-containing protein n=1 Tax=Bacillus cereus TaxID=1396 RepID=UPI000BF946C2|nr:LPXTG cell wall anchor domain-containing protein [Bacillus cereus]PFA63735.1 hypothetical protein CN403_30065 [Bacillus cereus]